MLSLIFFLFVFILINDTFSNLKMIVFIITGFICSNKEVKHVILFYHSGISPTLQMQWGFAVMFILQNNGGGSYFPKQRKGW